MKIHEFEHMIKAVPVCILDIYRIWFQKTKDKQYEELKKWKDTHKGERCFFIGTGPSLTVEDVQLLEKETVFLCNYGITLCDQISFKPDFYLIADPSAYTDLKEYLQLDKVKTPFIVDMVDYPGAIKDFQADERWNHLPGYRAFFYIERALNLKWKFSKDVSKSIYSGASIIYYCYQLAAYMGFTEIYLLGMDCDYSKDKVHFVSVNKNTDHKLRKASKWYNNNFIKMHSCAKMYCDKLNIKIYNATRGGRLDLFERVELEDVIGINNSL